MTALAVNDLLQGDILKTTLPEGVHYYNRIDGQRYDFTHLQFRESIVYEDLPSGREEAFSDTNAEQYFYLKNAVMHAINSNL